MAIYPYRCEQCGRVEEIVQSISSYSDHPIVPQCHGSMVRIISAPLITFDTAPWAAYQSPIDGEVIDSRSKRNEHMARHGVVMFDDIAPDITRNRQRFIQDSVADVKSSVIEAVQRVEAGHKPEIIPEHQLIPE